MEGEREREMRGFSVGMRCFSAKHTSAHAYAHTQALHLEAPWRGGVIPLQSQASTGPGKQGITLRPESQPGRNPPSSPNAKREAVGGAGALDHSPGETLTF